MELYEHASTSPDKRMSAIEQTVRDRDHTDRAGKDADPRLADVPSGTRMYVQGVRIDNIDNEGAFSAIEEFMGRRGSPAKQVFFTNVHTIHLARRNELFRASVNRGDLVLPDGIGLKIAGRMLGRPILENLNGTDFIPRLLHRAKQRAWSVYLFGAEPPVVEECYHRLTSTYPGLKIVGYHHGHVRRGEDQQVVEDINAKSPDILLVALGSPLQEEWISRNAPQLRAGVCFAVGGLFDFISGRFRRAPDLVRRIGAEHLYRFVQDPRTKWRRLIIEQPLFLFLVVKARLKGIAH